MAQILECLQIGEVAKTTGVSVHTIRYYEKLGLLEKPVRSPGGFRRYPEELIDKLCFIKKAKVLGLTLGEIKSIMQCSKEGLVSCCNLVKRIFSMKIQELESKIKELQKMKKNLESLLSRWISPTRVNKRSYTVCPQIERGPNKKERR